MLILTGGTWNSCKIDDGMWDGKKLSKVRDFASRTATKPCRWHWQRHSKWGMIEPKIVMKCGIEKAYVGPS